MKFKTTLQLPLPASATPLLLLIVSSSHFISVNSTYYCNLGGADPCTSATSMYESYARTTNCPFEGTFAPCDRYITPGWYTADDIILSQCPTLNSCGAVYPVWMNGTLPLVSDGVVTRKLCKVGFEGCCVRNYDLQIKNCGSQFVYCMPALDTCPERVCFGTNGSCEYPTTTTTTITTTIPAITTDSDSDKKVPLKQYKELESRYVAIIVVLIVLLSLGTTAAVTVIVKKYHKKKAHREVSQSKTELVDNGNRVESPNPVISNGNPPHLHFRV